MKGFTLLLSLLVVLAWFQPPVSACEDLSPLTPLKGGRLENVGGKYLLRVEGSPYEMGYQHGYLLAKGVQRMTKEFIYAVVESYGIPRELTDLLKPLIIAMCHANEKFVPKEFREEMKGIVDGANDYGNLYLENWENLSYEDVLLLNLGFDILLSIAYPIITPLLPLEKVGISPLSCDGFVVKNRATADGKARMGRNFMFTAKVFSEEALLIEHVPSKGKRFVSVTAPGFVGVTSAMNEEGLAIGMDMVPAMNTHPAVVGMGCLLLARKVVQYSRTLEEAVWTIKKAVRGTPWLYIIGDGKGRRRFGAVIETSADFCEVRYNDYIYPSKFPLLPKQIEEYEDVVALANHYIIPEMVLKTGSYPVRDSLSRYEELVRRLTEAYGRIDDALGRELVNYLWHWGYYGADPSQPIGGSRTLYNLTDKRLYALFGTYADNWACYDFSTRRFYVLP
ncbi:MAG: C45 family peptidase [Candidatus Hadarchaeales archaeon]